MRFVREAVMGRSYVQDKEVIVHEWQNSELSAGWHLIFYKNKG